MKKYVAILLITFLLSGNVFAGENKAITKAGDIGQILIPVTALGTTLIKKDWEGTKQFCYSFGAANAVSGILKYTIDAKRPNGKDHSFPSGHTTAAFAGASFIHMRYGWTWGVPAYAYAGLVGYSRVQSKNHYWRDVLAGAGIGITSNLIFTRRYEDKEIALVPIDNGGMITYKKRF